MKMTKRILSFLLCALMICSPLMGLDVDLSIFDINAEAADLGGIEQTRIVSNYESLYASYADRFFLGNETNGPTNFVIPGLSTDDNYVPQGMTYWKAKEWILISAYDADEVENSVIYAIDAATTEFVALFKIKNIDGSVNKSHGGGIAASEHNFYYADSGSNISYWPLAEMDVADGTVKEITIYDSIDCAGELNGAATSYCCYDEGVLWTGNFWWSTDAYKAYAHPNYKSMLIGYKLAGTNSAEEWAYLNGAYNKEITITTDSGTGSNNGASLEWKAYEGSNLVNVAGSITAPTAYVDEFCPTFGSVYLEEGKDYIIEFTSTNKLSDLYLFAPGSGGHTNVNQSSQTTITELDDGTYHYSMYFTAGLKPAGADSAWPTTQSTDGTYTGTYSIRFDQDAIQAGEARDFAMTGIRIAEAPVNQLKLTQTSATVTKTNAEMTYSISANVDGSYDITGTATNTSGAKVELTGNYAKLALVEGETYTMEFTSTNNFTDAYIFAPAAAKTSHSATHMRLFDQRGTLGSDGLYHYSTTFTAGKNLKSTSGGDYTWPVKQSTDGSFTGLYTIRFDQDDIQDGETRNFTISDIKLTKAATVYEDTVTPPIGVVGDPTYCIAFNDSIDRIQYAMVDKGKIYISRSWSRTESTNHIRALAIGDIDINSPGELTLTINGKSRNCHYVDTSDVTTFSGQQMFFMGEALCVINDYLYMFGESAASKYLGGDGGDTCPEPIDVIWKIDQYAIMEEDRPVEDVKASHYEKVTSLNQLTEDADAEYLVVFESPETDPVTQNKILYALDSFGGYGENKLPKYNLTGTVATDQAATGDSMGVVGYEISDYSTNGDILYVSEEVDSQKSLRWNINATNVNENGGANSSATITLHNSDLYYSSNPYFTMGNRNFAMGESAMNFNLYRLDGADLEDFVMYIGSNYIWCNFNSAVTVSGKSCMEIYSNQYKNHSITAYTPNYDGLDEVSGTFHTDAINAVGGSMLGEWVADFSYGYVNLYKRVKDEYSSTYQSRVFTDMNAELQSDGTYEIDIESYALSNIQYQKVDERPTDFIFVLDASGSMTNNSDATGYHRWTGELSTMSIAGSKDPMDKDNADGTTVYCSNKIYYQHNDGTFCVVKCSTMDTGEYNWALTGRKIRVKVWYTHNGTNYYMMSDGTITTAEPAWDSCIKIGADSVQARADKAVYTGEHYSYESVTRLQAMQNSVNQLTYKIASEASSSGLAHRIAVTQFGSSTEQNDNWLNTGMYTNTSTSFVQYSGPGTISSTNYANAFYDVANFGQVRTIINNIVTSNGDPDTFSNYGFDMASEIINNSSSSYLADGDRSVCIIMITDGVPGVGGSDSTSANNTANSAIAEAHEAKQQGAYVYSVQMGNNSMSGFNMDRYMDYVSSEFIDATSMTNSGDRNVADIDYRIDVPTGSEFNLNNLVNAMFDSVTSNSTNAMVKLDANSILREELTDAFDISNATVTVSTSEAKVDGLGRFSFEAPVENTSAYTTNISGNTITVKGFDYSTNYVHTGGGKKLVVTLKGVLANADAELVNTSINNTDTTAIYQTEALMGEGKAFKYFPTENFTIPEYNYILDFEKPMYDNDVNGTLLSVDSGTNKQSTYKTSYDSSNIGLDFVNNNQDLVYSLNSMSGATEANSRAYCLIERDDGTYDWFRINILPASNFLYEAENNFEATDTITGNEWTTETNGSATTTYQTVASADDVYGYDAIYNNNVGKYSNGTALKTTVDSTNKRSQIQSFTFKGTGFELYGECGPTSGVQIVTVKNSAGQAVQATIVDAYYNDTYGTLTQVPLVSLTNLDYDTYTVQVASMYLSSAGAVANATTQSVAGFDDMMSYSAPVSGTQMLYEALAEVGMEDVFEAEELDVVWFDDDSLFNGGYGTNTLAAADTNSVSAASTDVTLTNVIDSIRVYNPVDPYGDVYADEYYITSEKGAQYYNIADNLLNGGVVSGNGFFAYVEGNENADFATYESIGSKDEIYLGNSTQALTFNVSSVNADSKIMISMRAAIGSPIAKIGDKQFALTSSTEMYYDVTDYAVANDNGTYAITIQNVGNGLLAVDNLKITGAVAMMSTFSLMTARMMMSAEAEDVEPNTSTGIVSPVDPSLLPTPEVEDTTTPDTETDTDASTDENTTENQIIAFFNKLAEFFRKIIETIMSLFGI